MYMIQTIEIQIFPIKMYAIVSRHNTHALSKKRSEIHMVTTLNPTYGNVKLKSIDFNLYCNFLQVHTYENVVQFLMFSLNINIKTIT